MTTERTALRDTMPAVMTRMARGRLGLTQGDFAQLLGIHSMTVSKWERGTAKPTAYQFDTMQHLAAHEPPIALNVERLMMERGPVVALALLVVLSP